MIVSDLSSSCTSIPLWLFPPFAFSFENIHSLIAFALFSPPRLAHTSPHHRLPFHSLIITPSHILSLPKTEGIKKALTLHVWLFVFVYCLSWFLSFLDHLFGSAQSLTD